MFSIKNLKHQFADREVLKIPIWESSQGEHCLLRGSSGSGKTTLLHILAGLLKPTSGEVILGGVNLSSLSGPALDKFRANKIGLLMQRLYLLNALTVKQNLLLAARLSGSEESEKRLAEVLAALELSSLKDAAIGTLSYGEAQRVAIGRSVMNRPAVILADEPTSSLDDKNCGRVASLLIEQAKSCQATLVIATHDSRLIDYVSNAYYLDSNDDL